MNLLRQLREERGLNARKIAEILNTNYQDICRYENEQRDIRTELLIVFVSFFEVSIDYLLGYSCYYIYLKYNDISLKINEEDYYSLLREDYIYFDNNNHRCVKLNELIGLDDKSDLSEFIIEMNRCNRINDLFDKNSFGVVSEEYVNKIISDVEIILDSRLVKFIRNSIK